YAITDAHLLPGERLYDGVAAALQGGARIIQYRNKSASDSEQLEQAKKLVQLCHQHDAKLIINDAVELCVKAGADGVHLGRCDGDVAAARARLGADKLLGVTCHDDLEYARRAAELGADYCAFGRLFPSQTKPDAPHCPLERIAEAKAAGLCVVAIGGITQHNASQVLQQGADMLAVIHDLFSCADIEAQARRYAALFT
ncbi:MAG: thiamine phosphate synthase, partial [Salinisphaeraceae bacterium]|nr:thiamine phosphate synthase [Salinisphaeraceae bacterium]